MKNKLVTYIDLESLNVEEKAIFQLSEEETTIELAPNPIWITAKVSGNETYLLKCKISSETLSNNSALFQLQFLDEDKNVIEGPYDGFSLSSNPYIGYYKYLPIYDSKIMSEVLITIKILPNTCYIKGGFRSWANISSVNLESHLEIFNFSWFGKQSDKIWNLLNQPSINLDSDDFPENIDFNIEYDYLSSYFNVTTKYQEFKLELIENREYPWLKSLEIENLVQFIENIQKCKGYQAKFNKHIYDFDLSAAKNSYIESICPWSGMILKSNQSFLIDNRTSMLFYRFIGHKVFYLIVGGVGGHKLALYFPSVELIININPVSSKARFSVYCNMFKSYVVLKWHSVINYLSEKKSKDLVGITGTMHHFGHTVLNEYPSYHELSESNLLINFKKFLIGGYEFIPFDKLFPEVNKDDIIRKSEYNNLEMFEYVLKKNYFIIRPTNASYSLNRDLAKRIDHSSVNCLQNIGTVNQNFPILWFEIRHDHRIWLNQSEGIAEIVNCLCSNYPNLAVIFAGWSYKETDNIIDSDHIKRDQEIVTKTQGLINPNIPIFTVVGHKISEKISWAGVAHIHIITFGTGHIFSAIANKPTVIHTNRGWYPSQSIEKEVKSCYPWANISIVPIENVTEDQPEVHYYNRNYYCNWQGIYHEIIKILNILNLTD